MQVVESLPDVCNPLMTNKPVRSILDFFFSSDDDRSRCEVYGFVRMRMSTVPNLKGDPKYSERGPKGDMILSKKGT